ncbi:hypothetical protein KCU92_g79, partial [Aureobasidium melanogenum]
MLLIQANGNSHVFVGQYRQENLRFIEEAFVNSSHTITVTSSRHRTPMDDIQGDSVFGHIVGFDLCTQHTAPDKCTYNVIGRDVLTIIHTYRCILLQLDQVGCRNPIHSSPESSSKHSRWNHALILEVSTVLSPRLQNLIDSLGIGDQETLRKQSSAQVFLDQYAGIEVWMQVEATFLLRTPCRKLSQLAASSDEMVERSHEDRFVQQLKVSMKDVCQPLLSLPLSTSSLTIFRPPRVRSGTAALTIGLLWRCIVETGQ